MNSVARLMLKTFIRTPELSYCFTLGYTAWYLGKERMPCLDKKFIKFLDKLPKGTKAAQYMEAWLQGWDEGYENKKLKDEWLKEL